MAKIHISQRFGTTPNQLLYNSEITLKAKGLYGYIQAKPDDWNFSAEKISLECKEAIDSIRLGLKELEKHGYLVRKKHQNQKGHWEIDYILLAEPILRKATKEIPMLENTPNNTKKDLQNNINNNTNNSVVETKVSPTTQEKKDKLFPDYNSVNLNFDFGEEIPKKVAQKKVGEEKHDSKETKQKLTLFRNSDVFKMVKFDDHKNGDYSEFEKEFSTPEFEPIDLVYYFQVVSDWSDTANKKRTKIGWLSTIRRFIRGDAEKNKVKLKPEFQPNKNDDYQGMLDILNGR